MNYESIHFEHDLMGIRNLHSFLRKAVPLVYEEVSLTTFAYKRIAIDLSIYLCKFKASYKDRWLDAFLNMVSCLRENEVHFVFILDSKSPPEKENEKRHRQLQRDKLRQRIVELERAVRMYLEKSEVSVELRKYVKTKSVQSGGMYVDTESAMVDVERMKGNLLDIRGEDFVLVKRLFDILRVPYYYAVSEAEATCAHLCLNGQVDAVLTEDTDILAYGCPLSLHRMNVQTNTVQVIRMPNLLRMLDLTYLQFRDFCIMCGTDYNTNIFKIGTERAYRYIKEFKSIDRLESILNTTCLNHHAVRRLFTNDIEFNIREDDYCGRPDRKALSHFMFHHNCQTDIERVIRAFEDSPPLHFIEEKDDDERNDRENEKKDDSWSMMATTDT